MKEDKWEWCMETGWRIVSPGNDPGKYDVHDAAVEPVAGGH